MNDHNVPLRLGVIQATPIFVLVQMDFQSISGQRELGVDNLDVANENSGSRLSVELRFLRCGNFGRTFRTTVAAVAE